MNLILLDWNIQHLCMIRGQMRFSPLEKIWINGMGPISQCTWFAECHSTDHLTCKEGPQQISYTILWDIVITHPLSSAGYKWEFTSRSTWSHLEKSQVIQNGKLILESTQRVGTVRGTSTVFSATCTLQRILQRKKVTESLAWQAIITMWIWKKSKLLGTMFNSSNLVTYFQ